MSNHDALGGVNPDRTALITSWLGQLARAVRHQQQLTQQQRTNMIAEYAEMLLRADIPASAYCLDGLAAVTTGNDWWPPVAALVRLLEDFALVQRVRGSNASAPLRIAGRAIKNHELSPLDREWLRGWQQGESLGWNDPEAVGRSPAERENARKIWISMLKRYAPQVYEMVSGKKIDERDPSDWKDRTRLSRSIKSVQAGVCQPIFFKAMHAAVTRHAPENLELVESAMEGMGK